MNHIRSLPSLKLGVEIDPVKMGKQFPVQEDVPVKVVVFGSYEDNRFDHAFGTHDPGSGFVAEKFEIYALDDVKAYDENGDETTEILFKKNDKIDEKFITDRSVQHLEEKGADALTGMADYRRDSYDERYDDDRE